MLQIVKRFSLGNRQLGAGKRWPKMASFCIPLTHDLHRRNWIASGAVDVLRHAAHTVQTVDDMPIRYHRTRHFLRLGSLVARARIGHRTYIHKLTLRRPLLDHVVIAGWRRLADPEGIARRIEARLPISSDAWRTLDKTQPTMLLVPSLIHETGADDLVKAAKERGVPVVVAPASWDSLTTKGGFLVRPDALLVWGAASARHAERDHGFALRAIAIVGPSNWDLYFEPRPARSRTKILIAGTSVAYWRDEEELADRLMKAFPGRVIYRRHPRRGGEWSWKACLELRDQLDESAVVVASFSTVIVEAALQGIPSCVVAFGRGTAGGGLAPLAEYEHMASVLKWPGVRLCGSWESLRERLSEDLLNLGEIVGLRTAAREVADADGRCRERIAEALTHYHQHGRFA